MEYGASQSVQSEVLGGASGCRVWPLAAWPGPKHGFALEAQSAENRLREPAEPSSAATRRGRALTVNPEIADNWSGAEGLQALVCE